MLMNLTHLVQALFAGVVGVSPLQNVLVENRANPKSCCKGKCQLKKQLSKIENDTGTKNENNTKLNKIVCLDVFDIMDSEFNFNLIRSFEIALHYSCFQNNYSISIPVKLLRPPSNLV
jgi:hypothetical protein